VLVQCWCGAGAVLVRAGAVLVRCWCGAGAVPVRCWCGAGAVLLRCWYGAGARRCKGGVGVGRTGMAGWCLCNGHMNAVVAATAKVSRFKTKS
jgi:hypothetical protein